ncbi:MAG TPA: ATP-binding protein [Gammaproteobacteria bacterium]|jgi:signal transduction histidine kinase|nr:ATP-binding protein [Gammaproteobacteria bacterium]
MLKPYSPGLAGRLALATGVLVTLAVGSMYVFGVRALHGLAEADALTRVTLGVVAAREGLRQSGEDLLIATRVLSERPTLQRLITSGSREALQPYLVRYCSSTALEACGVLEGGEWLARTSSDIDWEHVLAAANEQGERFLAAAAARGTAVLGAQAPVIEHNGVRVIALRRMDDGLAARLSERAAAPVTIADSGLRPGGGPLATLTAEALERTGPVADYVRAHATYAAVMPVATAAGETVAFLRVELAAASLTESVDRLEGRMLLVAIMIVLLATASSVLIGRYWISAVERLTNAAQRLGGGDLTASFPIGGGKELTLLGSTMETMRRNLVDLTAELRRRERQAQAVVDGIIEGVYAVDEERRIRFLNPQAERLLKISSQDALGTFCGDVLKPKPDAQGRRPCDYACPILEARRAGAGRAAEQVVPVAGEGVRRVVIASAAPADADGLQVQVLRDETELEAVRRTRDTVLANISHEFRTPLAAQLASIELLRDGLGTLTPDAQRELVASLQRGTQRLTWLIDNLLESVRIESGQLGIRHQDVALDEIVVAARELIEPLIEQRGQRIEARLPDDLPVVSGDRQRLTQVLVNLLANASKFGPTGSTIRVGGRALAADGLEFWVEDEGAGPPNVGDASLFEQFRRAGGEKDPDESGLGLGLFIVRSIVTRHGGVVRLVRTAQGRTRAEVRLPKELAE